MKLIHAEASPEALNFFRTAVFGTWLLIVLFDPFTELSYLPTSIFKPTGVLIRFLPAFVHPWLVSAPFLYGLKTVALISLFLCTFNKSFIPASLIASVCLTIQQGIVRSYGHMNHAEMVLLYEAYFLSFFALADRFWKKDSNTANQTNSVNLNSIPFIVTIAFVCFAYTFLGMRRLIYGGVGLFFTDSLMYWVVSNNNLAEYFTWHSDIFVLENPWLKFVLKLGFPIATLFEICAPLCLVSRRFRFLFIAFMIPFHILIWVFMGILFLELIFFYILLFECTRWLSPRQVQGAHPIVFFDGVCALCNRFVNWVLAWDRTGVFRFAPLQGTTAKEYLEPQPENPKEWSILLKDEERVYKRSEAVLRIVEGLGGLGKLAAILRCVPLGIRDGLYDFVARHRYQWFGKRDVCRLPKVGEVEKLLS